MWPLCLLCDRCGEKMEDTWTEITVTTSQVAADAVSNRLIELGAQGTVFEELPEHPEECVIKAYYPQSWDAGSLIASLHTYLDALKHLRVEIGKGEIVSKDVVVTDWSSSWKQHFKPFRVGQHFLIKPSWETVDRQPSDLLIEIDPGMAFGTGLHASTRLALTFLERLVQPGDTVLDVGTGSGILSIAAARLGAAEVLGIDIDAEAVEIARENVRMNFPDSNIQNPIELAVSSIDTLPIFRKFHGIVMNIRPDVIRKLVPFTKRLLYHQGWIIIAGILREEGIALIHDLSEYHCEAHQQLTEEEWIAYVIRNYS